MAFSKDNGYYTQWVSDRGTTYILVFVAGDVTDLTSPDITNPSNRTELPWNFLVEKPTAESGFDNDEPVGLALADEMEFSIDLTSLSDVGTDDYSSIREWILKEQSTSQATIYGTTTAYVPNRWVLYSYDGSTYTIEYEGCQLRTPEVEIEINESREIYTIKCLSIARAVCQAIPTSDIDPTIVETVTDTICELAYSPAASPSFDFAVLADASLNQEFEITTMANVFSDITDKIEATFRKFKRDATESYSVSGSLYDNWVFYQQSQTEDSTASTNISSPLSNTYIINKVTIDTDIKEALFEVSNNSLLEYENVWDLLKYWFDESLQKAMFQSTTLGLYLYISQIETRRGQFGTIARATIEASDIVGVDHKIIRKNAIVAGGVSHIPNVPDESRYKGIVFNDVNEINYSNDGILNDDRQESELLFHNHPISSSAGQYKDGSFSVSFTGTPAVRGMYIKDGSYVGNTYYRKISDYCTVSDGTDTYTPETGYDTENLPSTSPAVANLTYYYYLWLEQRLRLSGKGLVTAKAMAGIFGNIKQFILETRSLSEIYDLGKLYMFDIDDITTSGMVAAGVLGTGCQIVKVKKDYSTDISDITLYFRGT